MARDCDGNTEVTLDSAIELSRGDAELVKRAEDVEIGKLDAAAAFAGLHQGANGLHVVETDGPETAANPLDAPPKQPALNCSWQHREGFYVQSDGRWFHLEVKRFEMVEFG